MGSHPSGDDFVLAVHSLRVTLHTGVDAVSGFRNGFCRMNPDGIFTALNQHHVEYVLFGGVNHMLVHEPVTTFDVDIWINDTSENLTKANCALHTMEASWGADEKSWGPVPLDASWLLKQPVFSMLTKHGPLDFFREVLGLEGRFRECHGAATIRTTSAGVLFYSLADRHMLECQLALPPAERKLDRIRKLHEVLGITE